MTEPPHDKPDPATAPRNEATEAPVATGTESPEPVTRPDATQQPLRKMRTQWQLHATRNLWIAVAGLAILLFISVISRPPAPSPVVSSADRADVRAVRAQLQSWQDDLNRRRAELGKSPLPPVGEGIDDITARISEDANTLVSIVRRYQELVAERDAEITEKNLEIIRAGQRREALAAELEEALAQPGPDTGGTGQLEAELTEALERAARLADELASARQRIEELEESPPDDEIEILNRRLEEAKSARDFFEERAERFEALLEAGAGDLGDAVRDGLPDGEP